MRIQKLIAAFLLLAQMSFAQTSWFTHHPVWTNNYIGGWIGAGTSTYSIGTDTIINGHQAVNIQRDYVYNLGGGYTSSRPVQQSGDTIFVFKESGQRSVLYNFSQSVGDTVQMATVWGGTQSFMITATGTQVIDGVSLRFQEWEQIEQFGSVKFYITVYERIGAAKAKTVDINTGEIQPWYSVHFFVDEPAAAVVDGDNNDLCLFYDDFIEYTTANPSCSASGCTPDIKAVMVQAVECVLPQNTLTGEIYLPCDAPAAFYQLQPGDVIKFKASPATCVTICQQGTQVNIDCFELVTTSSSEPGNTLNTLQIAPNPAPASAVKIGSSSAGWITVYDLQGKARFSAEITAGGVVHPDQLVPGIYFVVLNNGKHTEVKKLVVF